ncbi:MAG: pentapeptide repeat-containing protein [Alphaproteobacteria bacterium]|nr:MAG: pentapeptide repeat-containing protein [Alphaproteobacteria bacterium]
MDITDHTFKAGDELAFMPDMRFEACLFQGFDFTLHDLTSVQFVDCTFTACKLANLKVLNTLWRRVQFEECNVMGINWCNARKMEDVGFLRSKLDFAVFQQLDLQRCQIKDCSAREVDFSEADLRFSILSGTDFSGATFQSTKIAGADFRQSRGYVFDLKTTPIQKAKFSLPEAAGLLVALGAEIDL